MIEKGEMSPNGKLYIYINKFQGKEWKEYIREEQVSILDWIGVIRVESIRADLSEWLKNNFADYIVSGHIESDQIRSDQIGSDQVISEWEYQSGLDQRGGGRRGRGQRQVGAIRSGEMTTTIIISLP